MRLALCGMPCGLLLFSCTAVDGSPPEAPRVALIPRPAEMAVRPGRFLLQPGGVIGVTADRPEAERLGRLLATWLEGGPGLPLVKEGSPGPGAIHLVLREDHPRVRHPEGYQLEVGEEGVELAARRPAGLFYGLQTLRQLLPPEASGAAPAPAGAPWSLPCLLIRDEPRFFWRGMHLDVSRHFFPVEFVKRYIDLIARHKMNVFHWHLTDDNGWRLEIEAFPELTGICAWRVDREDRPWRRREPPRPGEKATYGGFYTREEVKEVVAFARERFVTVVPEIEMPGHTSEVFAAFPELSCRGERLPVQPGSYWPNLDIFCAGREEVFTFLEKVLDQVCRLFPSPYIHIGGDEACKDRWRECPRCRRRLEEEGLEDFDELQSWFIRRVEKMLRARGKRLLGWDEILQGGLAPGATVMSWRGMEGGAAAARQGRDAVMCPTSHCYFDYAQGDRWAQPPAIGRRVTTLEEVYAFEPLPPGLSPAQQRHILGAQGNLWTEYIPTPHHAEYMALPRLSALAEVVWSPAAGRDFRDFRIRLRHHFRRLEALGVNYCSGAYRVRFELESRPGAVAVTLRGEARGFPIRYTLDGSEPGADSPRYEKPLLLQQATRVRAAQFREGRPLGPSRELAVDPPPPGV